MSDIFREVDEDLRHEQLKRLWDRFGPYVIGVAILIVVVVAGYKLWEYWQARQAAATGDRFVAALNLADEGKHDEAIAALAAIGSDGSGGYPILAAYPPCRRKGGGRRQGRGGIRLRGSIARGSTPKLVVDMAKLRAAFILSDTANLADLESPHRRPRGDRQSVAKQRPRDSRARGMAARTT